MLVKYIMGLRGWEVECPHEMKNKKNEIITVGSAQCNKCKYFKSTWGYSAINCKHKEGIVEVI